MKVKIFLIILIFSKFISSVLSQTFYDVQMLSINCPNGNYYYWNSYVHPSVSIKNSGNQTIEQLNVYYKIDNGQEILRELTNLNLQSGQTREVFFTQINLPEGNHTVTARVEAVNFTDVNPSNNSLNAIFTVGGGDLAIGKIIYPTISSCSNEIFAPALYIKNLSDTEISSFTVSYRLDFFPLVTIDVNQTIPAYDSILVEFDSNNINFGSHSIQFLCSNPNNYPDSNNSNNSYSMNFNYQLGNSLQLQIQTDSFGNETSWNITNSSSQIVASGSGYSSNTLYIINLCLQPGCYRITIFDSYGDGMCSGYGNGFYKLINLQTNQTITEGCSFTYNISHDFCQNSSISAPIVSFTKSEVNNCTGEVQFTDQSICNPAASSWLWNFGDGHTSTEQNPLHIYNVNGLYSVSLQVTNANGTSILTVPNFVEINRQLPPPSSDIHFCKNNNVTAVVETNEPENIFWFTQINDTEPIHQGNSFALYNLTESTTLYYQYISENPVYHVGLQNNSGPGGYFGWSIDRAIYFDTYSNIIIKSAKVYASGSANRTITLKNSQGTVIATRTIYIPNGESTIDINLPVSVGTNYALHLNPGNNLSYTGTYGGPNIGYPFTVDKIISITGNNYSNSFWYFFYNIEILTSDNQTCTSARVPLNLIMSNDSLFLGNDTTICFGNSINLCPGNNFQNYEWNNGADFPVLTVNEAGTYSVTTTDIYGCTASGNINIDVTNEIIYNVHINNSSGIDIPDGNISIEIINGDEPFSIVWNNSSTNFELNNLLPGVYSFTLTDANNCQIYGECTVEYQSEKDFYENHEFKIYPNPAESIIYIDIDYPKYIVEIIDLKGFVIMQKSIHNDDNSIDLRNIDPGIYILKITTDDICSKKKLIKK